LPIATFFAERPLLSTSSIRGLRTPGYLIMATIIIMPFVDLAIRTWPFRMHSAVWRIGFLGGGAALVVTPLLALYLVFAIAAVADDRLIEYLVCTLAAMGTVLCLGAAAFFALDVIQMKGQVSSAATSQYDIGSMWVIARLVVVAVLFVVLALSSMRAARSAPRKPAVAGGRISGQMLIRTTPPGTPTRRDADIEGH
jgi:hypothetical protein